MQSLLIAVEGIDGSGKSTLVRRLSEKLEEVGHSTLTVCTREKELEDVFAVVMQRYDLDPNSPAYMFFFQMLHAHKAERVRKALKECEVVIADRWSPSFFVYHKHFGFFSKESDEIRAAVSRLAFGDSTPDLGIYLDVSVETALKRRVERGEAIPDLESERAFYEEVTGAYRCFAQDHDWVVVDANKDPERVHQTTWNLVETLVNRTESKQPHR